MPKIVKIPSGAILTPRDSLYPGLWITLRISDWLILTQSSCRYQNIFRVVVWLFFLVVYSQAGQHLSTSIPCSCPNLILVREPLERLDERRTFLDEWEIVLYIMALSFFIESVFPPHSFRYTFWQLYDLPRHEQGKTPPRKLWIVSLFPPRFSNSCDSPLGAPSTFGTSYRLSPTRSCWQRSSCAWGDLQAIKWSVWGWRAFKFWVSFRRSYGAPNPLVLVGIEIDHFCWS